MEDGMATTQILVDIARNGATHKGKNAIDLLISRNQIWLGQGIPDCDEEFEPTAFELSQDVLDGASKESQEAFLKLVQTGAVCLGEGEGRKLLGILSQQAASSHHRTIPVGTAI